MNDYEPILRRIEKESKVAKFRPAAAEDLARLARFRLPQSVIAFYQRFEPDPYVERDAVLMPVRDVLKLQY